MSVLEAEIDDLARRLGFRTDTLEVVAKLLRLLVGIRNDEYTRDRLILKGGTAINLFVLDVPRLSVDIDLNYIGELDGTALADERLRTAGALQKVLRDSGLRCTDPRSEYALTQLTGSFTGRNNRRLQAKIDVIWTHRVPLWDTQMLSARVLPSIGAFDIRVADVHELVSGKIVALLDRAKPRDLFDVAELVQTAELDPARLRLGVVALSACTKSLDLRERVAAIDCSNRDEVREALSPYLGGRGPATDAEWAVWQDHLLDRCRGSLTRLLPINDAEREFLDRLLDHGEVRPDVLTDDAELASRIARHPGVLWRAENVRRHLLGG